MLRTPTPASVGWVPVRGSKRPTSESAVTVVGGGLAGLVSAICCAEQGARVRLLEAHTELGGRARSSQGPYVANLGPHATFLNMPIWKWLKQKGLLPPLAWSPIPNFRFLANGRLRRTPPTPLTSAALRLRFRRAPDELDFRTWVKRICGEHAVEPLCGLAHVLTFDHDSGRLSAAFVWERLVDVYMPVPPRVRYIVGGWTALVGRLVTRAEELGVSIAVDSPVTEMPAPPVIVATELDAARRLLGDEALQADGTRTALLDLGLRRRRGDPEVIFDFDGHTFVERFSAYDHSLAPPGHELVQAHAGIRPAESADAAILRIESALDAGFAGWRERVSWRRRQVMESRTGALDLPGSTWRDRPAVNRGEGIFLSGDMVAAPGVLSQVSVASAREAAALATAWLAENAPVPQRALA